MMRRIIELGLKFRLLMVVLALGVIVIGLWQLRNMPTDTLPEFAPPYIEVQTEALGLSETEVEELVTFNLEELLSGLPWLQSIRSTSIPGHSSIFLFFEPGTDVIKARQLVNERLSLAYTLPNVAQSPVIIQPLSALSRVMMIGLSSHVLSPIQLSILARWTIQPALLSVPGVANVAIWGYRDQQLQVQIDPKILAANRTPLDKIISTAGNSLWVSPLSFLNASTPGSGGWVETPQQRIEVRHVTPIITPNDLAQVTVDGTSLRLGDVANLVEGHQPLIGDDIIDNGTGLLLVIGKFPGANTLAVTRGVEEKLATLKPGLSGVKIDTFFRPASFIEKQMYHNGWAFIIGLVLLTLFLLLVFDSLKAVLISVISIIVSILAGVLVAASLGASLNIMVLTGLVLAIAIVVDDTIVNITTMTQYLRNESVQTQDALANNVILAATLETLTTVCSATIILFLTLLPIFFLSGLSGAFLRPVVFSYVYVILASIVVALLITPALAFLLLSQQASAWMEYTSLKKLKDGYNHVIDRIMLTISPGLLATVTIAVSILVFLVLLWFLIEGKPLIPDFKENDVMIQWDGPPGTSAIEMKRISTLASQELRAVPGVLNVAAIIGRAILGDKLVNVNSAELTVTIDPKADYDKTLATIHKIVNGYPGIFHVVQTYLKEKIRQALTGANSDLVLRIYGPDLSVLQKKAEEIKQIISTKIKGATDVRVEQPLAQPQINIEVDLAKARHYGLKPGDVRRTISTYLAGIEVGSLFQEQKIFPVVVWGTPDARHSIDSIKNLLIDTSSGQWIPLSAVATVEVKPTLNLVEHENVSRRIDVSLNVGAGHINAMANQIKQVLHEIKFPLEYRTEVFGAYQSLRPIYNHFVGLALLALALIFLLLQAILGSFRLAAILFFILPSALVGGMLIAFAIHSLSYVSLLGFITVYGLATRNSIQLIKHYQNLEKNETQTFNTELIKQGAMQCFAPTLIAAIAVCIALFPFAVIGRVSGLEIINPLILIILGGTVTATLLTLFVVPPLYFWLGRHTDNKTL